MASAVFEGTSLVNMYVKDCWVNGLRRLIVSRRGEEEEFFEIRTEWSDRNILYLHRSYYDLGRLFKKLMESFPEDKKDLLNSPVTEGLLKIKEAGDIEVKLIEVEKLLKKTINMPWKYSRSEVVLTFFERSPLDQVLKNDSVHNIQPCLSSLAKVSEIMRSNGFCLANTETIVYDESLSRNQERRSVTVPAVPASETGGEFLTTGPRTGSEGDYPEAYVTNLSYYHLVPFETDILE